LLCCLVWSFGLMLACLFVVSLASS
jgi:hypothetical protein